MIMPLCCQKCACTQKISLSLTHSFFLSIAPYLLFTGGHHQMLTRMHQSFHLWESIRSFDYSQDFSTLTSISIFLLSSPMHTHTPLRRGCFYLFWPLCRNFLLNVRIGISLSLRLCLLLIPFVITFSFMPLHLCP